MISNEIDRLTLVRALIEFSKPLEEITAQLAIKGWDYDGEGVELTRMHLVALLQRYLDGKLSASDIEAWANCIKGREDVCFEKGQAQKINDLIYELANPRWTLPLDMARAKALIEDL